MEEYIKGNKSAWEEAFDLRASSWGADIVEKVSTQNYPFFNEDTITYLKKHDLKDKVIGQFCCNNGRELLSLVKTTGARKGIGFDIAENQIAFANEKAKELNVPCEFVATNILDIDESYNDTFDFIIITIGALCWFKDLNEYFEVVARCAKQGCVILINEQHPFTNMIPFEGEDGYEKGKVKFCFSYFEHEWIGNNGIHYITGKSYQSKTLTDYTHPISDIIGALCKQGFVITDMAEYDSDISDGFEELDGMGVPLSLIIEGKKIS